MPRIETKICGLKDAAALDAALEGGAAYIGFNFYPPSPRAVALEAVGALAERAAGRASRVGLFVDPSDAEIEATLAAATLDMVQLHGAETPERTADVRARFGLPVIKANPVADAADVQAAARWRDVADILLFDAKPPQRADALPGGNAESFDWPLLAADPPTGRWMLSGGLTAANVGQAVRAAGAHAVDVSSGVEARRGQKDPALIRAFLAAVAAL